MLKSSYLGLQEDLIVKSIIIFRTVFKKSKLSNCPHFIIKGHHNSSESPTTCTYSPNIATPS